MNSQSLPINHIPFVEMRRQDFYEWEKKINPTNKYKDFSPVLTTFITKYDLKEKARTIVLEIKTEKERREYSSRVGKDKKDACDAPLIWAVTVGFMSSNWVNKYSSKKEYSYRFGTRCYSCSSYLFLAEDIIAWAHRRIKVEDIKNAHDIIAAIVRKELVLE